LYHQAAKAAFQFVLECSGCRIAKARNVLVSSVKALVESTIIAWAREETRTGLQEAASAAGVDPDRVLKWEAGEEAPTVAQLRLLAKKYRVPFALFYLPEPPASRVPKFRDYRTLPEAEIELSDRKLTFELIRASEKREVVLEHVAEEPTLRTDFPLHTGVNTQPDALAGTIRRSLGLSTAVQAGWRSAGAAFTHLRDMVETLGMLVLQMNSMPLEAVRGFSLSVFPLPVIVVNRKDAPAARVFTLAHELVHLAISTSSVCDLSEKGRSDLAVQRTEVFCNAVAGRILVPREDLLSEPEAGGGAQSVWPDNVVASLARRYGVSREVVLRRLVDVGLATPTFYRQMREQYESEARGKTRPPNGRLPRPVDVYSQLGRRYVGTMLAALDARSITQSDFSSYVGLRLKHLPRLRSLL
jgi:Zn-dependent peptidase ImmA (M78 family)